MWGGYFYCKSVMQPMPYLFGAMILSAAVGVGRELGSREVSDTLPFESVLKQCPSMLIGGTSLMAVRCDETQRHSPVVVIKEPKALPARIGLLIPASWPNFNSGIYSLRKIAPVAAFVYRLLPFLSSTAV